MRPKKGFTLIELLIVVAIIAILAAIAIPNFLEAQVRSKVSRAKADMRSVTTAIEAYFVDANKYPNDCENGWPWYLTQCLTTPLSYITSHGLKDPFRKMYIGSVAPSSPYWQRYRFVNYKANGPDASRWKSVGPPINWRPVVSQEACDLGESQYGAWKMSSAGPDRNIFYYGGHGFFTNQMVYDPTNGTVSLGDIIRCQKYPEVLFEPGVTP